MRSGRRWKVTLDIHDMPRNMARHFGLTTAADKQTLQLCKGMTYIALVIVAFCLPVETHYHRHGSANQHTTAARTLQETDVCFTLTSAVAVVNTTVQLQASQQLIDGSATASLQQALSQYLYAPSCNIQTTYDASSTCLAAMQANTSTSCANSMYICRGVVQVSEDAYNAITNNTCIPNNNAATFTCLNATIDITTYLDIQQRQCCLQCPNEPACSVNPAAATAGAPAGATDSLLQCSNFSVSLAVGDSLSGSSAKAQLADAVDSGVLDQYLHAAGLLDTTTLSVGPTGQFAPVCQPYFLECSCVSNMSQDMAEAGIMSHALVGLPVCNCTL